MASNQIEVADDFCDVQGLDDEALIPFEGAEEAFEPGTYEFECVNATKGKSKQNQPMVTVEAEVVSDGPMKGRKRWVYLSLVNKDFPRRKLKGFLTATGVPFDSKGFSVNAIIGSHFEGVVVNEPWQKLDESTGETVERVSAKLQIIRAVPQAEQPKVTPAPVATKPTTAPKGNATARAAR